MGKFEPAKQCAGDFLGSTRNYVVPDYQREYAWTELELEDLWNDLENTKLEKREHFFGMVVLDEENDVFNIIDGQQRISTSGIYLAALRDCFLELVSSEDEIVKDNSKDRQVTIKVRYFFEAGKEPKLQLGETDKMYYRDNIQMDKPHEHGKLPSQKRIENAYYYFYKKLHCELDKCKSDIDKFDLLDEYYDSFIKKFHFIVITTDDANDAFIIFETLNARGKDLETSDLLKNHLFKEAGSRLDVIKDKWLEMVNTLDKKEDITKLIRYYWNATEDFSREKELYKNICNEIRTPSKCESLITNLIKAANVYNTLNDPENNKNFDNIKLNSSLKDLKIMGASSFYPIIIAMDCKKYKEIEISNVAKALSNLIFRNNIVAGETANKQEIEFAKIAKSISIENTSADDIVKKLVLFTKKDEEIESLLENLQIKKASVAKMVLRKIAQITDTEIVNENNRTINLEHIMPQKKGDWEISDEEHDDYVYRLGNLTLLLEEYNKSISNKVFSEKKQIYKKSKITMNSDICVEEVWTPKQIVERQKRLIEQIKIIWK